MSEQYRRCILNVPDSDSVWLPDLHVSKLIIVEADTSMWRDKSFTYRSRGDAVPLYSLRQTESSSSRRKLLPRGMCCVWYIILTLVILTLWNHSLPSVKNHVWLLRLQLILVSSEARMRERERVKQLLIKLVKLFVQSRKTGCAVQLMFENNMKVRLHLYFSIKLCWRGRCCPLMFYF